MAMRPVSAGHERVTFDGFTGVSVLVGFVIFIIVTALLGLPFGLPIIATFVFHEIGRVLAYRMLGHEHTRFRLVPFLSAAKVSDQPLRTDGDAFLVSIIGPALCLAPMSLALALSVLLSDEMPALARSLWLFTVTCGALNFFMLLPFRPLPGATCARAAVVSYWPALAPAMTVFMATAMATASLRTGSVALMVGAVFGAQTLFSKVSTGLVPMKPDQGLVALSAYAFALAAHFSAGWLFFSAYFQ